MKKYIVRLTEDQRSVLEQRIRSGTAPARALTHARILLKADANGPAWTDQQICTALEINVRQVEKVRHRFCEQGMEAAVQRKAQPARPDKRRIDGDAEAKLIALACSTPPEGYDHWTLDLLADRMVKLNYVEKVSRDTVRRTLKKTSSSPG